MDGLPEKEESRHPVSRLMLVALCVAVPVLTIAGFVPHEWLPPAATRHGAGVDVVIRYLLATTGIVFVAGHAVLGWFVWRFARGPATYRPAAPRVELLWALVPVVVMAVVSEAGVIVLGAPVFKQLYATAPENPVEVEVVGKQFEWFVRYPGKDGKFGRTKPELVHEVRNPMGLDRKDPAAKDDVFVRGVLRLPVDRTAMVRLRTHDVQHSFAVPAFRVKQDLVPGFPTSTRFEPVRAGQYEIVCAELCGLGHYKMRGEVHVLTADEYEKWLAEQIGWFE